MDDTVQMTVRAQSERSSAPGAAPQQPRDIVAHFESLGGSGYGAEFAHFQQHFDFQSDGLLAWADLGVELLSSALEQRFSGVGEPDQTIVFAPGRGDEWWTKNRQYWMASRAFLPTDDADEARALDVICRRLRAAKERLIADLTLGNKIFVFRSVARNLTDAQLGRLHAAVRSYGPATLLYVRYSDADHPAGMVYMAAPGLLVGYVEHFTASHDGKALPFPRDAWLTICRKAAGLVYPGIADVPEEPPVPEDAANDTPSDDLAAPTVLPGATGARHIVLIGNCQMQAMAELYRRHAAGRRGDVLVHVPTYKDLSGHQRRDIEQADLIVEQLFDLKQQADTGNVRSSAPRVFVPMVTAGFLWPFAGSPHPKNQEYPFLTGGPYAGEASDSYLNRQILAGVDPEEAVEAYANLDVNRRMKLDRLYELVMDRQQSRDRAADFHIAEPIERHFRDEQIFLSPYHPNLRIAMVLASQLFQRLGAPQDDIDRMVAFTRVTPFPKTELPVHPSVVHHFGLTWVPPDRTYRFMNEGSFTFREFALRYMRYEWNEAIEEGMHLFKNRDLERAAQKLTEAVQRSPQSATAYNALAGVLHRQGDLEGALAAARQSTLLEPESAGYHSHTADILRLNNRLDEAAECLWTAIALDPTEPHYRVILAHVLRQQGETAAACEQVREAVRLEPHSMHRRIELVSFLEANDDFAEAGTLLNETIAARPSDARLQLRMAQLHRRANRLHEAIAAAREALTIDPELTAARMLLSDLALLAKEPTEALREAYLAAVVSPDNAQAYSHLGHVLLATGDVAAAELALRRAIALAPNNAHAFHQISVAHLQRRRYDDAIAAARESIRLEPGNPARKTHLDGILASASGGR